MKKVDFANLKLAYNSQKEEIDLAISKVLDNSNYIMGNEIELFERKLSVFTGSTYSYTCSSGTDALILALMAINISPGDEVITTPFSFIATAETIAFLGTKPVFVDIDEKTYNIDVKKIECKITSKTKAIIPVSLFGQVVDFDEINEIANSYNLFVIEDAAQSFGAKYKGKNSCNIADISCTSFFPAKPLGCYGDGGAIFTNNKELADKIKSLRIHGQESRYVHKYIGIGGRMDTIQAAVLNVKIDSYFNDIKMRNEVSKKYSHDLKNHFTIPFINDYCDSVWAQYSIRSSNRKDIMKFLSKNGIPTAVHYPKPLHLQECFEYLNYKKGDFPISEKVSDEIFSLPMNPYLTDDEIDYICLSLKSYIK